MLTLYDVASAAGVSIATVSRVMHEQPGVRPATRQRVLDVIEELGYVPDGAAQSMARHRKEVIGLVTAENPNADLEQEGLHYVEEILRGVEFVLSRLDWSVLFSIVRPDLPDVIVCANDKMAIGAIRELQSAGDSIPADVAVSGFDDIFTGSIIAPPLTTVRQPTRLLGERACAMLLERIANPSLTPRVVRLSAELLIRQSCGCPPATLPPQSTAPQTALVPQPATATPPR